ncbi:MAG: lactate dehydrogenase-like 2-hydroxyacid dehydrogenase [Paracoccaceae bacterium]|jgi:lactate dehydrogenase-like 2-hydroxyacid dehydrogenase
MKPNLLMIGNGTDRMMARLNADFTPHLLGEIDDLAAFLAKTGPSVEYVMTNGHAGLRADIMDNLPNLKVISSYGVGYDAIDTDACAARGIVVTHTPGVLNDEVANTAIMLWLAASRRLVQADNYLRAGRWLAEGAYPLTRSVQDRTVGILGLGRIGQAIADRLGVFNATIVYHSRTKKDIAYRYYDDLTAMAADCDVLICITPGGEETRGIVNTEVMNALGSEGILINVARGSVVDEPAMVSALQDGRLGGAGLDVFDKEPVVPEALFAMDNVVLQPHVASGTVETRQAMGDLTCDNLIQFKTDGTTVSAVPECAHL